MRSGIGMSAWRICWIGYIRCKLKLSFHYHEEPLFVVPYRRLRDSRWIGRFLLNFLTKKQERGHGFVYKRLLPAVSRWLFVNLVAPTGILMTVRRVRNMFDKGFCPWFLDALFLAWCGTMCADYKTSVFRTDEEERWQVLQKRRLLLKRQFEFGYHCCLSNFFRFSEAPCVQWKCRGPHPVAVAGSLAWSLRCHSTSRILPCWEMVASRTTVMYRLSRRAMSEH